MKAPPQFRIRVATWTFGVSIVVLGLWILVHHLAMEQPSVPPLQPNDYLTIIRTKDRIASNSSDLTARFDPSNDDWRSEQTAAQCSHRLKLLANLVERQEQITTESISHLTSSTIRTTDLLAKNLGKLRTPPDFAAARFNENAKNLNIRHGRAEFVRSLSSIREFLGPRRRIKFKLHRIHDNKGRPITTIKVEAGGLENLVQFLAVWECEWEPSDDDKNLQIAKIELHAYEEIQRTDKKRLFLDGTKFILGQNASYQQQQLPGIHHWLKRLPNEFLSQFGHHGIAIGDVNGDSLDDIYVCDAGGLPNRLYLQRPDGTAVDISTESQLDILDDSVSALMVDLDNDSDQDIVVATGSVLHFLENDGKAIFATRLRRRVTADIFSISSADFDVDGDLDLYVCGYDAKRQAHGRRDLPFPIPYNDANNGAPNVLLSNQGDFTFVDVTKQSGLDQNNTRFSMAAAWEDFDNDGDVDLYVANDFGRNNLYRNDAGRFTDIAAAANVQDHASGMSVDWADCNRDGWMDLYVGNMYSSAGNRVTYQSRFSDGVSPKDVTQLRRMSRGNTLFLNQGHDALETFVDISETANVNMGRWAWGSKFADLTNDGWQDIVVANGYLTNEDSSDL